MWVTKYSYFTISNSYKFYMIYYTPILKNTQELIGLQTVL